MCSILLLLFFFFKQKTAYEMRISDWSSDVCSSDLRLKDAEKIFCPLTAPNIWELRKQAGASLYWTAELMEQLSENVAFRQLDQLASKIGRASCRERVCRTCRSRWSPYH